MKTSAFMIKRENTMKIKYHTFPKCPFSQEVGVLLFIYLCFISLYANGTH